MMRIIENRFILPAVFLILIQPIFSQYNRHVSKAGTAAAAFLEMGVGARALSMGDAFVSMADDATGLYWNPAGISSTKKTTAQFFNLPWIADIRFNYAAIAVPIQHKGVIGLSATSVTMNDMMVRTIDSPEGTGEKFGANDVALGISYGRKITDSFSFGFNVKFVQQQIYHMSASTMAIDIGSLFITRNRNIRIGMNVSNFGEKLRLEGKDTKITYDIDEEQTGNNDRIDGHLDTWEWPLPLIFRVGMSTDLLKSNNHTVTISIDAVHPNDNVEYVNAGVEYSWRENVFLRAGQSTIFMDNMEQGPSIGAGIRHKLMKNVYIQLDYVNRTFGVFNSISGFSLSLTY